MSNWKRDLGTIHIKLDGGSFELATHALTWALKQVPSGLLLAHAQDGVVWGTVANGTVQQTSHTVVPEVSPNINWSNPRTLQQARIFSESAEAYIWHDGLEWHGRSIHDAADGEAIVCYNEWQIVWGTDSEIVGDFTRLDDGSQGLIHAVPGNFMLPHYDNEHPLTERIALQVRHYLGEMPNGMNITAHSRFVGLEQVDFAKVVPLTGANHG